MKIDTTKFPPGYKVPVRGSLKHYDNMITFVEKIPGDARKVMKRDELKLVMISDIGECWYSEHCALCKEYAEKENSCANCPLDIIGQWCDYPDSIWRKMNRSTTAAEWLVHARELRDLLRSILEA